MIDFYKRVEIVRVHLELNKGVFSEKIGSKSGTYATLLKGKTANGDLANRLYKVFNVNAHWLITGDGLMLMSTNQYKHIDIVKEVYEWNEQRGLLDPNKPYNQALESSFIAEELSELLRSNEPTEWVDAHIDSVFFQLGALSKLLGSHKRVTEAFSYVIEANKQKSNKKDSNGKVIKDKNSFIEPQKAIKKLLDEVPNKGA